MMLVRVFLVDYIRFCTTISVGEEIIKVGEAEREREREREREGKREEH